MRKNKSEKFGERIRELRLGKGLTQGQLAEKAGVSDNFIGMVERAERNISLQKVFKLAKSLGVKTSDLFNFD